VNSRAFNNQSEQPDIDPAIEIAVDELVRGLASASLQVIDVRERDEWDEGRIAGSMLIPMSEFAERVHEIDPTMPIITVCRVGARSLYVAEALLEAGFPNVKSLAGGLNAWVSAGQPLDV
jgi:rhodanese-related sulfurtransferase